MSAIDDAFALAHLDLAHEFNDLVQTLRYEDLTSADLAALVAILRPVQERRQAREATPAPLLRLAPRKRQGKR